MAKVSGFGHSRSEVLDALRALGLDPNMIRRFSVEMGEGWIPTLQVEAIADPRIIDLALTTAGQPNLRIDIVIDDRRCARIRTLCLARQTEARDGGQTDADMIWPSEILAILDSSDGA